MVSDVTFSGVGGFCGSKKIFEKLNEICAFDRESWRVSHHSCSKLKVDLNGNLLLNPSVHSW